MYALISSPLAWRYLVPSLKVRRDKILTISTNLACSVWLKKHYGLCIAEKMIQRRCVVVIDAVNVLFDLAEASLTVSDQNDFLVLSAGQLSW